MEALLKDNERKQRILDTQEISQHDLDRIKKERTEIGRQIERAKEENKSIEEEVFKQEMQIGKLNAKVDTFLLCSLDLRFTILLGLCN